jgi:pimeloyl-ACP methyl ester carboxylesterase
MSNDQNPTCEPKRHVMTQQNEDGSWTATSLTTAPDFKIRAECLVPSRLVVPVIFVPGVMGTRLRVKDKEKSAAWLPPEGTWEGICVVLQNRGRNAAARQRLLDPNNTEVDESGIASPDPETATLLGDAPGDTPTARAKWRGWGQLHADSYQEILKTLELQLATIFSDGQEQTYNWKAGVSDWQDAQKLGAQKPFAALDDAAFRQVASVFYPVHAVGYNFLQSNKNSGERLASKIDEILNHYTSRKFVAEKVLVVTHSMGGFVTRACLQMPGSADKIIGVVHGVMPTLGAPAFYKRLRAGFEGGGLLKALERIVLGRGAGEAAAVLANAPGPLELVPTRQYQMQAPDGARGHWLNMSAPTRPGAPHHPAPQGHPSSRVNFPGQYSEDVEPRNYTPLGEQSDPHGSIYMNNDEQCWWRMVKEELINPAGREDRERAKEQARKEGKEVAEPTDERSDFDKYSEVMKKSQALQNLIEDKYHPNTYAFYAADAKHLSWNQVHWKCRSEVPQFGGSVLSGTTQDDDLNGTIRVQFGQENKVSPKSYSLSIEEPLGLGDGTVPQESGMAPTPHVVQIFRHEGKAKKHTSYDHQNCYKADIVKAVTLYSISNIMFESAWLKANLHKA